MAMDEREDPHGARDAAEVGRLWDAAVRGRPVAAEGDGLDPTLVETIRRLHARDATPGPSPATTARIWEELMDGTVRGVAATGRAGTLRAVPNGRPPAVPPVAGGRPRRARRRSPLAELATAALVLLTLGLGIAGGRLLGEDAGRDGGGARRVGVAGGPDAPGSLGAPGATADVPAAEACRVAPRTVAEIRRLNEQAAEAYAQSFERRPVPLPTGPPADAETVAAVERTMREDAACAAAGDQLRAAALRTNGYLLRSFAANGPIPEAELAALGTPTPDADVLPWELIPGEPVRVLPDGLVGAPVKPRDHPDGFEWAPEQGLFLVFARVGDRYLLDDEVPIVLDGEGGGATPPAAIEGGGLEIVAIDETRAMIGSPPGACYILVGPIELPPICDDETEPVVGGWVDADPAPGVVRIDGVPVGSYEVQQRRAPAGFVRGVSVRAEVVAGEVRTVTIRSAASVALIVREESELREQPAAGAPVVATLAPGERLEATGPAVDTGGESWWYVLTSEAGRAGWVRDREVEVAARASPTAGGAFSTGTLV